MELPFTIVFEAPSRRELRAAMCMRGVWVAVIALALAIGSLVLLGAAHAGAAEPTPSVALEVRSQPSAASVWVDGRDFGQTPVAALVSGGRHAVVLKPRDGAEAPYVVEAAGEAVALEAMLWRRQPRLVRLRPTLPGASLADVRVLADGQLGLVVALPPANIWSAWRLEPISGALAPLLAPAAGERVAIAADGERVAYLGYELGPPPLAALSAATDRRSTVLWVAEGAQRWPAHAWRPALGPAENLIDASWSPAGDRLLVVSSVEQAGGSSLSHMQVLELDGMSAREVLSLPSAVVAGSAVWSPDGSRVAFLAHAGGQNAICWLDLASGAFRYLADLEPSTLPPLPYPAAAWSADSRRLVFIAPRPRPPGSPSGWFEPQRARAVYVASGAESEPTVLADTDLDGVAWREDGGLLGLGRVTADGALDLRTIDTTTSMPSQRLLDLPLRPAAGYAVAWDLSHARLLLANPSPAAGAVEYWLVMLGLEAAP